MAVGDGGMVAAGPCWACGVVFGFDPETVPSIPIDPVTGLPPDIGGTPRERAVSEPVCPTCVEEVRARRVELGQPSEWTASGWA